MLQAIWGLDGQHLALYKCTEDHLFLVQISWTKCVAKNAEWLLVTVNVNLVLMNFPGLASHLISGR